MSPRAKPFKVLYNDDLTHIGTCVSPYHKKGELLRPEMIERDVDEVLVTAALREESRERLHQPVDAGQQKQAPDDKNDIASGDLLRQDREPRSGQPHDPGDVKKQAQPGNHGQSQSQPSAGIALVFRKSADYYGNKNNLGHQIPPSERYSHDRHRHRHRHRYRHPHRYRH